MPRTRFSLAVPLILALAVTMTACIDATPESATNLVGGSHEITANLSDEGLCDEVNEECAGWAAFFAVVEGPGAGETNLPCDATSGNIALADCIEDVFLCMLFGGDIDDCQVDGSDCDPAGCTEDLEDPISWTYENNGDSGTDYIVVCGIPILEEQNEELRSLIEAREAQTAQLTDDEAQELIDFWEETGFCDVVTKTWIDPTPTPTPTATAIPNIARALSGVIIGGNSQVNAQQQQPASQQGAAGEIRPPNTGEGGLR